MRSIKYRLLSPTDCEGVSQVATESWQFTYGKYISEEVIQQHLDTFYEPSVLLHILPYQEKRLTEFWVALDHGEVVGFAQIGFMNYWKENQENKMLILFRLYVYPSYIGQGIGSRLLIKIEEFVKKNQQEEYYCFVHQQNEQARKFYERRGFSRCPQNDKKNDQELCYRKSLDLSCR